MKVQMRGKRVGVQKLGKSSVKSGDFLVMPEAADALGVIKYLGPDVSQDLKEGQKVFYGGKRERIRMGDSDIEIMDDDNVLAIVEGDSGEKKEKSSQ